VYAPVAVPGLLALLLELPQPVPTAITAKSNIARNTRPRRFCAEIPSRKKQAMKAPISLIKNQCGPAGRLIGLKRELFAVVLTVSVDWPLVVVVVNVMVELGVNEQVGGSLKLVGVTAHVRATVPVNPFVAVAVMVCMPD
jgi:hypothetical protein